VSLFSVSLLLASLFVSSLVFAAVDCRTGSAEGVQLQPGAVRAARARSSNRQYVKDERMGLVSSGQSFKELEW